MMAVAAHRVAGIAVDVAVQAYKKMRESGEKLLPVSWEEARELIFPVGHPRDGVVYIGHPVDARK
jgi:hypothetical protein